jgi:hypothetical protein
MKDFAVSSALARGTNKISTHSAALANLIAVLIDINSAPTFTELFAYPFLNTYGTEK